MYIFTKYLILENLSENKPARRLWKANGSNQWLSSYPLSAKYAGQATVHHGKGHEM